MAGSNATTRGIPRRILQGDGPTVPVISAGAIPTIQYSTGNARALQQFSRDLFGLSNSFEDQLDQQAEAEATTKGAIAGVTGDFQLQDYGTIRGRAFNKAAVETFAATMDTNSIMKLNQLQQQFWDDPAGLEREWGNYQNGVVEELSKRSPEQAVAFQNRATIRGATAIEGAKDTAYKLTRSQADAALVENEAALRAEIKSVSADLFSENPDRSRAAANAIGQVQNDFMNIYRAKDPTTGKPLYTPEEIAKAKKSFTDLTMSQATLSWFDEQPDKAGAYLKFISGDFKIKIDANNNQIPVVENTAGKIRSKPVGADWYDKARAAAAATGVQGIGIKIVSGGQNPLGVGGPRTGSTRHDVGPDGKSHTADMVLTVNGRPVLPGEDKELYKKFFEGAAAAGFTGIGHYDWGVHVGDGSKAAWGPNTKGNTLDPEFGEAINRGWASEPIQYKPTSQDVSILDTLSPTAMEGLDNEMRARINFANSMVDRQGAQEKAVREAQQTKSAFDYSARLYAAGSTDPTTGQAIKPLTREEVIRATTIGTLKPSDGEAILKAMATEQPETSDDATYRELQRRLYAGEDVYGDIVAAGGKLSKKDAAELLGKNQSVVRGNLGEFNPDQKYYFNTLNDRLGQTGIFDKFDQGKADRKAQALDEFRRRVMDPENVDSPAAIADDIANRATSDVVSMDNSRLGRMVMPRYSVPVQGQNRLDIAQSKAALIAARDAGDITAAQFQQEAARLVEWSKLQTQIDRQATAPKGK